jgi:hypothetical protein
LGFNGLGSRVQDLEFKFGVQGSGFRAWDSMVEGLGLRVQGSGFRVQGSGFRVQGLGLGIQVFRV